MRGFCVETSTSSRVIEKKKRTPLNTLLTMENLTVDDKRDYDTAAFGIIIGSSSIKTKIGDVVTAFLMLMLKKLKLKKLNREEQEEKTSKRLIAVI